MIFFGGVVVGLGCLYLVFKSAKMYPLAVYTYLRLPL
jgi:hypothetical protein